MNNSFIRDTRIVPGECIGFIHSPHGTVLHDKVASSPSILAKPFQISNKTPTNAFSGMLHGSLDRKRKHDSTSEDDSSVEQISNKTPTNAFSGMLHGSLDRKRKHDSTSEDDSSVDNHSSLKQRDSKDSNRIAEDSGKNLPIDDSHDARASLVDFLDSEAFAEQCHAEEEHNWDVLSSLPFHETLLVPWTAGMAD
jgi:hypothetical protein